MWKLNCRNLIFIRVFENIAVLLVTPLGRRVARNFGRGTNNNQVSTFEYIMPLVFKTSSTKCPFFWRLFFWIILFRFKPANRKSVFLELTKFQKFILSKFQSYYFNWKPQFLVKLSCESVCEDLDAIFVSARSAVFIFQAILQLSKKSSRPSWWLRFLYLHASDVHQHTFQVATWTPEVDLQNLCACRRGSCPILERLVDLRNW